MAARRTGSGRRWLLHPVVWLLLQALLAILLAHRHGGLQPQRVPDTVSYIEASRFDDTDRALSFYRTWGYPLLLRLVSTGANTFPDRWVWVPRIQLAAWFGAMLLWWHAVHRFGGSRWLAFAVATPLPWAAVFPHFDLLQPDFLAGAFVVACFALLLLLIERPRSPALWVALGVLPVVSYQLRPAGVFLIALLPLLGGSLALLVNRQPLRRAAALTLGLALLTAVPFVAFGALRALRVGHFGLVSFGGLQLSGLVAILIDDALIAELPPEDRDLAASIARQRLARGWRPLTAGDDPVQWFEQYSDNTWHISLPAVKAETERNRERAIRWGFEPDPRPLNVVWNDRLGAFSKTVIRLRPRLYLTCVVAAFGHGLRQLLGDPWVLWPAVLLVISWPVAALVRPGGGSPDLMRPALGVALTAVAYFAAYLLLVSVVSHPFPRYFASMTILLPGALCGLLFAVWRPVVRPAKQGGQGR